MDFRILNNPSVCVIHFLSKAGRAWREEHTPYDDVHPEGSTSVYCGRNHIEQLSAGMLRDGLQGTVDGRRIELATDGSVVIAALKQAQRAPSM